MAIADRVQLRAQAAFGPPDTSAKSASLKADFDRRESLVGFPRGVISDSESVLVKEAGVDGPTFIMAQTGVLKKGAKSLARLL